MKKVAKRITWSNICYGIGLLYVKCIEQIPYINWFNPFITLYLNFRSFPLKQAWKLPVFVFGWPKIFSLYGTMECVGKCKTGMILLNQTNVGMPNHPMSNTAINNWGRIVFHGKCQIYTGNKINVFRKGILEMGEGTKIMCMCNITASNFVHIGDQSWIVHRCQVMDSNFHFIADFNQLRIPKCNKPIEIGTYCWICNNTTVMGGAKIPNKTIVASNSLVNKDMTQIPEESLIGGIPAKLIEVGYRRVYNQNLEQEIWDYLKAHPQEAFFPLHEGISHSICDVGYITNNNF